MLDTHRLFGLVALNPQAARDLANVVDDQTDSRVSAVARMEIGDPWGSIKRYLRRVDPNTCKQMLVGMANTCLLELERSRRPNIEPERSRRPNVPPEDD